MGGGGQKIIGGAFARRHHCQLSYLCGHRNSPKRVIYNNYSKDKCISSNYSPLGQIQLYLVVKVRIKEI